MACCRMAAGIPDATQPNSAAAEIMTPVFSRYIPVSSCWVDTPHRVSIT